jgi:DNA-binding CsgD family transcriptional regulator
VTTGPPGHLTSDDIAVYQALTTTGDQPESPDPGSGSVDRLSRLGLVTAEADPVPPESAVATHVQHALDAVAALDDAVGDLVHASRSLHVLGEQLPQLLAPHAGTAVEVVEGTDRIRDRVASVLDAAQHEVIGTHPVDELGPEVLDTGVRAHQRALRRGVEVRSLHLRAGLLPQQLQRLRWLSRGGASVRLRSTLPFRMLLVDQSVALCAPPPDVPGHVVVVRGADLLRLLASVAQVLWADAVPLVQPTEGATEDATEDGELDAEDRQLLRLLAEGLSDRGIARKLGVAERTVTRRVSRLFATLGAATRFQAGVEAGRRGLL